MTDKTQAKFRELILEAVKAQKAIDEGSRQAGGVSKKLFELAKAAQTKTARMMLVRDADGNINDMIYPKSAKETTVIEAKAKAVGAFNEQCELAEHYITSQECPTEDAYLNDAGEKTVPQCWKQIRSNCKAFLEMGLPLDQFDTESKARKAKGEVNRVWKERKDHAKAAQMRKEAATLPLAGDFPEDTPDDLADAFAAMLDRWNRAAAMVAQLPSEQKAIWKNKQTDLLDELTLFTSKIDGFNKEVGKVIEEVMKGKEPEKRAEEKPKEGEISRGVREAREQH